MSNARRYSRAFLAAWLPVVLLVALVPGTLSAEGEEATITNRLMTSGIAVVSVSTSGSQVTVEYEQPVAEMTSVLTVLQKVGTVLAVVSEEMPSAQTVVVVQYFDDGQIMEVSGAPQDGVAFQSGQMSAEDFMEALVFRPVTRGPMIVPGECEIDKGENCGNCADCPCYPDEACDPGNSQADERGCVPGPAPANAHLVGSEYACNDGYEWNSDLSACVPLLQCPANAFSFQGECHCEAGYEWNASGTECVPVQGSASAPTDTSSATADSGSTTSGGDVLSKLTALIDAIVNWFKSLF